MTDTSFPSLLIRRDGLTARGSFAQAQATYLDPDPQAVAALDALLRDKQLGVVAHFYMDAELQGVLSACSWPHVFISDSLAMADAAVRMVEGGCSAVIVLGVDFMSENVRAVLDHQGHGAVPVYRVATDPIGCSLAASAEALAYGAWLTRAQQTPDSLHVVYINTSLLTKARAHHLVPTITCTSSNVVRTILAAFAQIPEGHVWYGPDTYMGENLVAHLTALAALPDAVIRQIHPAHDAASIRSLLTRFHHYPQGVCVVHHMFGAEVTARVRESYGHALITAHFEVPGEMFALAAAAEREGRGVVGSTSNILDFIVARLRGALAQAGPGHLEVVLGTESGMITSIVRAVRAELEAAGRDDVEVEIVFPVSSEAVAQDEDSGLGIIPGPAAGEGCSTAGGCATCPYMKMNSLDALMEVAGRIGVESLEGYAPRVYTEEIDGRTAAEVGGEPILFMRDLQREGRLPEALVALVSRRSAP